MMTSYVKEQMERISLMEHYAKLIIASEYSKVDDIDYKLLKKFLNMIAANLNYQSIVELERKILHVQTLQSIAPMIIFGSSIANVYNNKYLQLLDLHTTTTTRISLRKDLDRLPPEICKVIFDMVVYDRGITYIRSCSGERTNEIIGRFPIFPEDDIIEHGYHKTFQHKMATQINNIFNFSTRINTDLDLFIPMTMDNNLVKTRNDPKINSILHALMKEGFIEDGSGGGSMSENKYHKFFTITGQWYGRYPGDIVFGSLDEFNELYSKSDLVSSIYYDVDADKLKCPTNINLISIVMQSVLLNKNTLVLEWTKATRNTFSNKRQNKIAARWNTIAIKTIDDILNLQHITADPALVTVIQQFLPAVKLMLMEDA